jgi:hypothetical protein
MPRLLRMAKFCYPRHAAGMPRLLRMAKICYPRPAAGMPRNSRKENVYYHLPKSLPQDPVKTLTNRGHTFTSYYFNTHFNIIPFTFKSPRRFLLFRSSDWNSVYIYLPHLCNMSH